MRNLPPAIIQVLRHFELAFSERVWEWASILLIGAILAPGKRTVTAALRVQQRRGTTQAAPSRRVRTLWQYPPSRSTPHPQTRGPQTPWAEGGTRMDAADGGTAEQNGGRRSKLSRSHPCRSVNVAAWCGINHWRAARRESLQTRFGEGPTEKARAIGTSPAAYSTLRGGSGGNTVPLPD